MPEASSRGELRIGGGPRQQVALLGAVAFGVFGLALAAAPGIDIVGRTIGVITAAFFGLFGVFALVRVRRSSSIYVLADDGIRFPKQRYSTVPWSRVQGVRIFWAFNQRFLGIDISDPEALAAERGSLAKRALRTNLRHGWGALAISERLAPGTLEELAAEINFRRLGERRAPEVPKEPPPQRWRLLRALQTVPALVAGHGVLELTAVAGSNGTGQVVRRAVFGVLLMGGALLISRRPRIGVPLVVVTEAVLVLASLLIGHYPVSLRILSLFYPVAVLLRIAAATGGFRKEYRAH